MNERWRAIEEYPDYEVSDHGRVKRTTTRTCAKAGTILSTRGLRNGYPSVDLCREGAARSYSVHRLVAAAFFGLCPPGQEVNHINGNKTDNRATNLEYLTSSKNQLHAYRAGLQSAAGEKNGQAKLTTESVEKIRAMAGRVDRPSYRVIGEIFGVSDTNVRAIVARRTWKRPDDEAATSLPA